VTNPDTTVLALNGGSSSIKFALFSASDIQQRRLHGKIERIGAAGTTLTASFAADAKPVTENVPTGDFAAASKVLIDFLARHGILESVAVIGHRIVHGLRHSAPERITAELLADLRTVTGYDPEHLPAEIQLIEKMRLRCPALPQVACFDTDFHRTMPRVATQLPLPRHYEAQGVRRYGFHGLSYAYLMEQLAQLQDPAARSGRVILAHLGSGASLAAVRDGACVDTTMGFTPSAGVPMSTRCGDMDPGLLSFFGSQEHMTISRLQRLLNHESGLLGVSETSADVRDLLKAEGSDVRAQEAVALFCQEIRKRIGAFAAVLGGLDTLVFAGGIGENAPLIRERVCVNLEFLGVRIAPRLNRANAAVISPSKSRVTVRVIRTDEESMIARIAQRITRKAGGEEG
jgi:acetate kinase